MTNRDFDEWLEQVQTKYIEVMIIISIDDKVV